MILTWTWTGWPLSNARPSPKPRLIGRVGRPPSNSSLPPREVLRRTGADTDPFARVARRVFADDEPRAMYLSAVRGDYRALESYEHLPGATVACPVTALLGDRDPRVSTDDARAWRRFTFAGFEPRLFPGGHFYLDEWCAEVAGIVRDAFTGGPRPRP
jgi:hypothetical protein